MHLTGAILAGGRSRRFGGRDKSALMIDGQSILERQIAALSEVASDVLIVGRDTPHARARAVSDLVPGCGPLGGLHTALTLSHGDATVVVACDMPYVSAPLLAYLGGLTSDADAIVPVTDDGFHPLCAAYTRACIEPIARRLADGRFKMSDFLTDVRLRIVTPEELDRFGNPIRLLANVNTPAELGAFAARGVDVQNGHEL